VIRRRLVLACAGSVPWALPGVARAQRRPRIGVIATGAPEPANPNIQALAEGLREQGYEEGRHVVVDVRWAGGSVAAIPALAAELVALPVDVIVASNNNVIAAAQRATSTIPIVMVVAVEPVRAGFVDSFARPGRHITGLTNTPGAPIDGKMLGLLKELVPQAASVGVLVQKGLGFDRASVEEAARLLDLRLHFPPEVSVPEEIDAAFEAMKRAGAQAVYVLGGALVYAQRQRLAELESRYRLPGMHFSADYVRAGGLISYGTDLRAQYRRAAWYVARILQGARPAELPVEQPARFEMAINLKTARALGLTVPPSMLLRADEVIA
jgi:putative ABC transport system substrate-binding protein